MTNELLAGVTALVAVLVGPLVSLYVVRREFAAQVLSSNRQHWINTLRDRLARLTAFVAFFATAKSTGLLNETASLERQESAYALWAEISLLLNPAERDHAALIAEIDSVLSFLFASPSYKEPAIVRERMDRLTRQSQAILKREWERVKEGR